MGLPVLVDVALQAPEEGSAALLHDATFTAWDATFSRLRDVANLGIDALNHAGAGLQRLPEESLEELLVLPLTGDYRVIRQNAAACGDVRDALRLWAGNVLLLAAGVEPGWGGRAATEYLARLGAFGAGACAAGELVARGAVLFEQVAVFSENIGIRVERLLVSLGKALWRLARKLMARLAGPAGWASFALEVATKGLDAVTDIVADVQLVVSLVQTLLELRGTVAAWADEQRGRLQVLTGLPELVRS